MSAGYSGTPSPKKLGFKAGQRVSYVNPPADFGELLGELPDGVREVSRPDCVS